MILAQTIIVYLFSLFLMMYYSYKSSMSDRKLYYFIPIIVFTLLSGLRYGVGIDYNSYLELYEYWGVLDYGYDRLEPGFMAILSITNNVSPDNPILYFSVLGFMQILFIFLAFKERKVYLPLICFVLILSGIAMEGFMNGIRQTIAFSIFVYSIKYVIRRSPFRYYVCILMAFMFHKSALLLIPIYFIKYPLFSNVGLQLVLLIVSFLLMFFNPLESIVSNIGYLAGLLGYGGYLDLSMQSFLIGENTVGLGTFIKLIIYIVIILKSVDVKKFYSDKMLDIMYDLFLIGVFLSYIFKGSMLLNRAILYFSYMEIFVMAYVLYYFYKNRNNKRVLFCFIFFFTYMVYTFCNIMSMSEFNTTQYVFYFQDNLHYLKDYQRDQMLFNN